MLGWFASQPSSSAERSITPSSPSLKAPFLHAALKKADLEHMTTLCTLIFSLPHYGEVFEVVFVIEPARISIARSSISMAVDVPSDSIHQSLSTSIVSILETGCHDGYPQ